MLTGQLEVVAEGFMLPESPRWHDGRLWMADIIGRRVGSIDGDGTFVSSAEVPNRPSGLGWDPKGRLLIVSQLDARLLRLDGEELLCVSDHSDLVHRDGAEGDVLTNDMVVDSAGRAYISSFSGTRTKVSPIVRVDPDGSSRLVADSLKQPNGMVITPDGASLIVAEHGGNRIVQFTITDGGDLKDEKTFAKLDAGPDGVCLDAEGAIWAACPQGRELLRVLPGGQIVEHMTLSPRMPLAPMLGGEDGMSLFVMTVEVIDQSGATSTGRLETIRVSVPGAGLP